MGGHGLVLRSRLTTDSFPNVRGASSLGSSSVHLQTIGSIQSQVLKQGAGTGSLPAVAVVVVGSIQSPFESVFLLDLPVGHFGLPPGLLRVEG